MPFVLDRYASVHHSPISELRLSETRSAAAYYLSEFTMPDSSAAP
jgi:hypothetical protein